MKNSLLGSVAALALIIGAGSAFAQGTGMKDAPAAAAPKADSATPSRDSAAPARDSAAPARDSTTSTPKAETAPPTSSSKGSAAETAPASGAKSGTTAQDKGEPKGSKAANDTKSGTSPATTSNAKDAKNPTADSKSPGSDAKTTGNAATSATAAPPAEKRSQITSAIKQEKVEEVTNVNFNISVGTAVPSSVRYHPLPSRIIEIYPEWRGYDFIVVRGKYIILRPQTHEIVYIIEG
ncbi:DUF1236 domain-containing protein [uncultured Bradyrhizobium sp.]|uniref:DUF1236 domain-containing protein n=1 Tax=uncultured Bradyrhizobium sp. TaxID=199684 RepID=UPI0035CC559B